MTNSERVKKIICDHLAVAPERAVDDALIMDHLNADSLDLTELVLAFEEEFGIVIHDREIDTIKTVGDAIKAVERNIKKQEKK